jgi:hypothetical protein
MGVAPTGQQLTWSLLLMDKVTDGKIVLHHANADWISVLVSSAWFHRLRRHQNRSRLLKLIQHRLSVSNSGTSVGGVGRARLLRR